MRDAKGQTIQIGQEAFKALARNRKGKSLGIITRLDGFGGSVETKPFGYAVLYSARRIIVG